MKKIAAILVLLFAPGLALAQNPENLALGKKYTLEPNPNYHLCTDLQDKVQLTDGIYTKGYFWTQMTTVGWTNAQPVKITIDLQKVQPIRGLSFNTAAGVAQVRWPTSILVLVSDDNKTYYLAADLVELSAAEHGEPKAQGYGLHRFVTNKLRTHGRFVKLIIFGSGPFIFSDEIEIYKGAEELLASVPPGEKIEDINSFHRQMAITRGLRRRLRLDLTEVRKMAEECGRTAKWKKEFQKLENQISALHFKPPPDFRTVFPINDLHGRIFAIQAALWKTKGLSDIIIWQKNRWDTLSPTELPQSGQVGIDIRMIQNEYRGSAFNLSNAGLTNAHIQLTVEGLPGGTNPDYITIYQVPFTDTRSGVPIAAAMPKLLKDRGQYNVVIEPGLTKQIWLNFHPQNVSAGQYKGRIVITPGRKKIPVRFKVYPFRFPYRPTLHLGGWDYTDQDNRYQVTPQNRRALIRHLNEHFVDSPWATSRVLSRGKYDPQGNWIQQPDPQYFRQWIKRWPNARNYCVFASVGNSFAGFKIKTPTFKNAVKNWITWWIKQLRQWNIQPYQLNILLVDEPHTHEQDDTIIAYADVIRKAAPDVVIWEDPTWREPWKARPQLFELSDVLCPNLTMLIDRGKKFADFYVRQQQAGRTLWFYSCSGPGKLLDPYSYHRLQHWFCFKYKAKGSGFWAFGDSNGASSWNEYLTMRGAYTPVFLDESSVTAGKHMEAIREGIEDYEYLVMLKNQINELEQQGRTDLIIKKAKDLLANAADRVVSDQTPQKLNWHQPKDRSVADKVRIEILEIMTQLKNL
ncbi:MAG: hypothetical protein GWN67_25055 [Phycisphaerae bacterium]|nr:hypothetical protein [Phycisphaerae bacterium]NIP55404.1 hypothetical protein [Phycisphaerae bacterium]NIS54074.1 hypothetical protein [Phycisphaerae bacterium]NIU11717.1 hypothetical protein [Phycisphaerae bacterium]NIU59532.1 hypothetical protein [Phycisphaerae bacterium]